jgi:endogenous inhibitor of DNA gyrase (YacG/DUF329 family)
VKCPECGSDVAAAVTGRPRRFCSPDCSRSWSIESRRLAREVESVRRELAEAKRYAAVPHPPWMADGKARVAGLRNELDKLEMERETRSSAT